MRTPNPPRNPCNLSPRRYDALHQVGEHPGKTGAWFEERGFSVSTLEWLEQNGYAERTATHTFQTTGMLKNWYLTTKGERARD